MKNDAATALLLDKGANLHIADKARVYMYMYLQYIILVIVILVVAFFCPSDLCVF